MTINIKDLVLVLCVIFTGYMAYSTTRNKDRNVDTSPSREVLLERVAQEFRRIENKEDKRTIHLVLAGVHLYLENSKKSLFLHDVDSAIKSVNEDYSWELHKYEGFTAALREYMHDNEYNSEEVIELTPGSSIRGKFIKVFENLAEVTK